MPKTTNLMDNISTAQRSTMLEPSAEQLIRKTILTTGHLSPAVIRQAKALHEKPLLDEAIHHESNIRKLHGQMLRSYSRAQAVGNAIEIIDEYKNEGGAS